MDSVREDIKRLINEKAKDLTPAEKKLQEDALVKIMEGTHTPMEAMGLTNENLEAIYARAYRLYQSGLYNDAVSLFKTLANINGTEPKYFTALGACYQMLKRYELAIWPYLIASQLDPASPLPLVYLSDCYQKLGHLRLALKHLNNALALMGNDPFYAQVAFKLTRAKENLVLEIQKSDPNGINPFEPPKF